jgi:hypothetical protein
MSQSKKGGLAGREGVVAEFGRLLDDARGGRGGTILLTGEPGIGKTRLVAEFEDLAGAAGATVLSGKATAESAQPYDVAAAALGTLLPPGFFDRRRSARLAAAMALRHDGTVVASVPEAGTTMGGIAGVLPSIQSFVKDSLASEVGHLGRMDFGGMKIIVERGPRLSMVGLADGEVAEEMPRAMRSTLDVIESLWGGTDGAEDAGIVRRRLDALASKEFFLAPLADPSNMDSDRARLADTSSRAVIEAARSRALAVVFEDAHWADAGSISVLSYLARSAVASNLAILVTGRPGGGGLPEGAGGHGC